MTQQMCTKLKLKAQHSNADRYNPHEIKKDVSDLINMSVLHLPMMLIFASASILRSLDVEHLTIQNRQEQKLRIFVSALNN